MAKQHRPSLEALAQQNATTSKRDNVVPWKSSPKARASLPHVSVYIGKAVQRELKRLALDFDRKPHDLYVEALDLLLTKYGRPTVAELSAKDDVTS